MPKHLVIVESPAKAKTIGKYLGKDYRVKASVGHVRDLPRKGLSVDIENGFLPTYQVIKAKIKVLQEIREAAGESDLIYLAADPDREGEAIAWHVVEGAHIDKSKLRRISFHQVTKAAVLEAFSNPRELDRDLIDAQQARRVLDRLVGYQISPLLSKSMRKRLSAGRVQSVALRLIVDREREILAFVPDEYWTLEAELQRRIEGKERFRAHLHKIAAQNPELHTQSDVDQVLGALKGSTYTVTQVKKGKRQRRPWPPFITSTLQAGAGSKLHFSPRQTMRLAQQLYEGIDLHGERVGLITYMRTDSMHVAPSAQKEARRYVSEHYGEDYVPAKSPYYRSRVSHAQEAHEAIRPTSVFRTPEAMQGYLTPRQARLYDLIWRRFVASQMKPALYDTISVDIIAAKDYMFRATGQTLIFPGFLTVLPDDKSSKKDTPQTIPALSVNELLDLIRLIPEQHFTQPPPRYSEPTLIKALEANGVGRPSTYAAIVSVIQDRGYVIKKKGKLVPTDLGMVVCDTLVATFATIMDIGYTAGMEERLDQVASGQLRYETMLDDFYRTFEPQLIAAQEMMPQAAQQALLADLSEELRQRTCPKCGRPLQARVSKAGRFLGCTGYPECRYTLDLSNPDKPTEVVDEFAEGEVCELCGGRMKIIKRGRSTFLGCENYPKCKNTRSILSEWIKQLAVETACPTCGLKPLTPKKGRYGEYLYCPKCKANYSLRKLGLAGTKGKRAAPPESVDIACPECSHSPLEKRVGKYGPYYRCPACKTNFSEKKMAVLLEKSGSDST
jgi:DNA topoisomerase-1